MLAFCTYFSPFLGPRFYVSCLILSVTWQHQSLNAAQKLSKFLFFFCAFNLYFRRFIFVSILSLWSSLDFFFPYYCLFLKVETCDEILHRISKKCFSSFWFPFLLISFIFFFSLFFDLFTHLYLLSCFQGISSRISKQSNFCIRIHLRERLILDFCFSSKHQLFFVNVTDLVKYLTKFSFRQISSKSFKNISFLSDFHPLLVYFFFSVSSLICFCKSFTLNLSMFIVFIRLVQSKCNPCHLLVSVKGEHPCHVEVSLNLLNLEQVGHWIPQYSVCLLFIFIILLQWCSLCSRSKSHSR